MNDTLANVLDKFRKEAGTERDKGTAFETFVRQFLLTDKAYMAEYNSVCTYGEWAEQHGHSRRDKGIDLVATMHGGEKQCAIQCKFYAEDSRIQLDQVKGFIAESVAKGFEHMLFVDTTRGAWSDNAEELIDSKEFDFKRLGLRDLEESDVDWSRYLNEAKLERRASKELRPHQQEALDAVVEGFREHDRGKLIMACGTGKTYTALRIAERLAGRGKQVLYLVPSLALMSQSIREWSHDARTELLSFAVCSDSQVGRRKKKGDDDSFGLSLSDLACGATTKPHWLKSNILYRQMKAPDRMTVVFCTYHSLHVIEEAQGPGGIGAFDLIICDEAHRTTGVKLTEEKESNFVKVHDQEKILGHKRLYMTATPRLFTSEIRAKAKERDVMLCSMDDEELYGPEFHCLSFAQAVTEGLLTDYKVIVLVVEEGALGVNISRLMSGSEVNLDDASRIVGCYRGLAKLGVRDLPDEDTTPMRRAVAFCNTIKNSKLIEGQFAHVVDEYIKDLQAEDVREHEQRDTGSLMGCELRHIDGTDGARKRDEVLDWLREEHDGNACRILTNVRCLSEGVDVPALDAVLFLHPRKSQVEVVQSLGRVMRRAEGKQLGYVILPVGIRSDVEPDQALDDNERYRVVWQVLNALRSHDHRMENLIERISLGENVDDKLEIVNISHGSAAGEPKDDEPASTSQLGQQIDLPMDSVHRAIRARIVKKCGTMDYWDQWGREVGEVARRYAMRIRQIVEHDAKACEAFDGFVAQIRGNLNDGISKDDAIEMLAQHMTTRPVFDALFEGYSFAQENPVSQSMQHIVELLDKARVDSEGRDLDTAEVIAGKVREKVQGIESDAARQRLIVRLYDNFFRSAFPQITQKLGVVYTPPEVVDFILHSVNDVLKSEFGATLGSSGVHILDPFTGTGTFISRLIQSGLITPEQLEHKYGHEIHANEIVLLAYYIAAISIEAAYHSVMGGTYKPFEGICLTDTFQMYEVKDMIERLSEDNTQRKDRQKKLDIRVVLGNPPYSIGQRSQNDNAQNTSYFTLDESIRNSYVKHSEAGLSKGAYDSYIRAIHWASDRIREHGVIGFVTNAGWLDGNSMDGMRKCLVEGFSSLYIFNLRGNQRTSGELSRKEGGKIFGGGSRAPIVISILVKNPDAAQQGAIYYHDIGDYLSREDKLATIRRFHSIEGITDEGAWQRIEPDAHHDWLDQRDRSFDAFMPLGDKKDKTAKTVFENYSLGIITARDAWCYQSSQSELSANMTRMVAFYNTERERYHRAGAPANFKDFIKRDSTQISWTRSLEQAAQKNRELAFNENSLFPAIYRPFTRQWMIFDRRLNEVVYQMPQVFPEPTIKNPTICVTGSGAKAGFSVLMVDSVPNLDMVEKGQCFPLTLYDRPTEQEDDMLARAFERSGTWRSRCAITDAALYHFRSTYKVKDITKGDIFYYIYGLLHAPGYRARFKNNLTKQLPRIPCIKSLDSFHAFTEAGRALADLHLNFDEAEPYAVTFKEGSLDLASIPNPEQFFYVKKMRFGKYKDRDGKTHKDRTVVEYNANITMSNIPLHAYGWVVNGKPALEWVMDRQGVRTDKASGIVNDTNRYAVETVGDPAYPLRLFQRVITVSLKTLDIIKSLPTLEILTNESQQ